MLSKTIDFEEFRRRLELELNGSTAFELIEFHFLPYSFGSGTLFYRIDGLIYRLTYDGRDNRLSIETSRHHQTYVQADWIDAGEADDLTDGLNQIVSLVKKRITHR